MNLFGKKKVEDQGVKLYETIKLLSDTIESQEKRKKHIEKQIEEFQNEAKKYMQLKKKENAMFSLKKKKMCEKQVHIIDNSIFNLEIQKINLQNTSMYQSTLQAFSQAKDVLKDLSMSVEKVENVMDDLQDEIDHQDEISEVLSRPLAVIDVDDEMKELEELMLLEDEKVIKVLVKPIKQPEITYENLPNVPSYEEDIEDIKKSLELI
jgi:hypothetical protein